MEQSVTCQFWTGYLYRRITIKIACVCVCALLCSICQLIYNKIEHQHTIRFAVWSTSSRITSQKKCWLEEKNSYISFAINFNWNICLMWMSLTMTKSDTSDKKTIQQKKSTWFISKSAGCLVKKQLIVILVVLKV